METSPSLVLDLHNDWTKSIPYVLIDNIHETVKKTVYKETKTLAGKTGFITIVDSDIMTSTLSYNLLLNDVPALTLELGEPYVINEKNVAYGLNAALNILTHLEMLVPAENQFVYPLPPAYSERKLLKYSDKPHSSKSGVIRFLAKPGDEVKSGQPFARIVNAFGKPQETVKATEDGIVLGHSDSSVVFPGMPIMAFGTKYNN
jgi:predicted deacylase